VRVIGSTAHRVDQVLRELRDYTPSPPPAALISKS